MFKVTVKMTSARPQGGKRRCTELEGPLHPKRLLGWAEWDSSYPDLTTQEPSSEQTVCPRVRPQQGPVAESWQSRRAVQGLGMEKGRHRHGVRSSLYFCTEPTVAPHTINCGVHTAYQVRMPQHPRTHSRRCPGNVLREPCPGGAWGQHSPSSQAQEW